MKLKMHATSVQSLLLEVEFKSPPSEM